LGNGFGDETSQSLLDKSPARAKPGLRYNSKTPLIPLPQNDMLKHRHEDNSR
jgi:hypothetical protein